MKNPYIIPAAMICAAILAGFWMLKSPSEPQEVVVVEAARPEPRGRNHPIFQRKRISIHDAARQGKIEAVKQHLAAGTDVNAKDTIGRTPLTHAAWGGHKEIVELLIAEGADVNAKDVFFGMTSLHRAAMEGHKEIAELLIDKGADVNAKTKNGTTPLDWAVDSAYSDEETAALLRKHGGKTGEVLKAEGKCNTSYSQQSQPCWWWGVVSRWRRRRPRSRSGGSQDDISAPIKVLVSFFIYIIFPYHHP
jgi:hypothetical protein